MKIKFFLLATVAAVQLYGTSGLVTQLDASRNVDNSSWSNNNRAGFNNWFAVREEENKAHWAEFDKKFEKMREESKAKDVARQQERQKREEESKARWAEFDKSFERMREEREAREKEQERIMQKRVEESLKLEAETRKRFENIEKERQERNAKFNILSIDTPKVSNQTNAAESRQQDELRRQDKQRIAASNQQVLARLREKERMNEIDRQREHRDDLAEMNRGAWEDIKWSNHMFHAQNFGGTVSAYPPSFDRSNIERMMQRSNESSNNHASRMADRMHLELMERLAESGMDIADIDKRHQEMNALGRRPYV